MGKYFKKNKTPGNFLSSRLKEEGKGAWFYLYIFVIPFF